MKNKNRIKKLRGHRQGSISVQIKGLCFLLGAAIKLKKQPNNSQHKRKDNKAAKK